ncbi:hypothetical protein MBH78_18975 [Oceanimonas sp. NS1]|nr:hypothetical protein [Oceanimonas sp. NS1]
MTNEQIEQAARDTLNALLAGGHIQNLFYNDLDSPSGLVLNKQKLKDIEMQLRQYYFDE